jgi:hypothetical protein
MVVTPVVFTVRLAGGLVTLPVPLETMHRNWSPVIADVVPLTTSVEVAEPL